MLLCCNSAAGRRHLRHRRVMPPRLLQFGNIDPLALLGQIAGASDTAQDLLQNIRDLLFCSDGGPPLSLMEGLIVQALPALEPTVITASLAEQFTSTFLGCLCNPALSLADHTSADELLQSVKDGTAWSSLMSVSDAVDLVEPMLPRLTDSACGIPQCRDALEQAAAMVAKAALVGAPAWDFAPVYENMGQPAPPPHVQADAYRDELASSTIDCVCHTSAPYRYNWTEATSDLHSHIDVVFGGTQRQTAEHFAAGKALTEHMLTPPVANAPSCLDAEVRVKMLLALVDTPAPPLPPLPPPSSIGQGWKPPSSHDPLSDVGRSQQAASDDDGPTAPLVGGAVGGALGGLLLLGALSGLLILKRRRAAGVATSTHGRCGNGVRAAEVTLSRAVGAEVSPVERALSFGVFSDTSPAVASVSSQIDGESNKI